MIFRRAVQILALVLVGVSPEISSAAPIVIDFDSLTDRESIVGQFAGLTFSGAIAQTSGISLNEFELPPRSGLNAAFDDGGPMRIDFASSVSSVGGYFNYAVPFTLSAYDLGDTLLGSVASAFASNLALSGDGGSTPNEFISFAGTGIAYVILSGDALGGSFTLDDLTYAVPEPAVMSLVAIGLLGLVRRKSLAAAVDSRMDGRHAER